MNVLSDEAQQIVEDELVKTGVITADKLEELHHKAESLSWHVPLGMRSRMSAPVWSTAATGNRGALHGRAAWRDAAPAGHRHA
jgi:hypothetical protein